MDLDLGRRILLLQVYQTNDGTEPHRRKGGGMVDCR